MSLEDRYKSVITRICQHMGSGMAHYAREGSLSDSTYAIDTLSDFDLYCHYVAGLVGEGLSSLFSASGKEREDLGNMLSLSNSMGLMLQKTNIMRDFREDLNDGRFFWPKEIWSKYADNPKAFYSFPNGMNEKEKEEMEKKGLFALSEMILDALSHSIDCLNYLSLLKNQSVFQFCAIPQVMAIATLEKCFMNKDVFKKNVKIRKSLAVYVSFHSLFLSLSHTHTLSLVSVPFLSLSPLPPFSFFSFPVSFFIILYSFRLPYLLSWDLSSPTLTLFLSALSLLGFFLSYILPFGRVPSLSVLRPQIPSLLLKVACMSTGPAPH